VLAQQPRLLQYIHIPSLLDIVLINSPVTILEKSIVHYYNRHNKTSIIWKRKNESINTAEKYTDKLMCTTKQDTNS
jgi:hypothetical protein